MSIIKKAMTKTNSHQIKPIQNNLDYISLREIWELIWEIWEKIGAKFNNNFSFLKTINFRVINILRYQLKSLKCSFISTWEAIETCHLPMFNCTKFQSQWLQRLLL